MTFPSVVGSTGYASSGAVTSWDIFSGVSVAKGSILVIGGGETNAVLSTASTGWVKLGQSSSSPGTGGVVSAIFYASAANTAFTLASDTSSKFTAVLFRTTGGGTVSATSTTNSADPPSHSISSTRDALWVAANIIDGTNPSAAPSGYSGFYVKVGDPANGADVAVSYRTNAASSENPGAFTGGVSTGVVWTIALYRRRKVRCGGTL